MTAKPLKQTFIPALALAGFFLFCSSTALADCPNRITSTSGDALHMAVLGDSIMWGQGLKQERKFWWRVKCWLEEKTGREVITKVVAHSGAHLDSTYQGPPKFSSTDGEVNLPYPTINQQLDGVLEYYGRQGPDVDLVLVDGCINDVDVSNLLDATASLQSMRERIQGPCRGGMESLLKRIARGFPNAQVLVTGYYRIVSEDTDDNAFLRQLVKKINSGKPEARRMTDRQMRQKLIAISELWFRESTASLEYAVSKANADVESSAGSPRITFVEIGYAPEHAFAAASTLLWNFVFGSTNLSGIRKLVVALSFGTAAYKPNDDVRESRVKSCNVTYKKPKGIKETKAEKQYREERLMICRYASLGHPNQAGALIYAEAIKGKLQPLVNKTRRKTDLDRALPN